MLFLAEAGAENGSTICLLTARSLILVVVVGDGGLPTKAMTTTAPTRASWRRPLDSSASLSLSLLPNLCQLASLVSFVRSSWISQPSSEPQASAEPACSKVAMKWIAPLCTCASMCLICTSVLAFSFAHSNNSHGRHTTVACTSNTLLAHLGLG